jgi:hypothetical protein
VTNEPGSMLLKVLSPKVLVPLIVIGAIVGSIVLYRDITGADAGSDGTPRVVEPSEWRTQLDAQIAGVRRDNEAAVRGLADRLDRLERAMASQCKKAYLIVRSQAGRDRLYINGDLVGSTGRRAHEVCAGTVDILIEAEGFADYRRALELAAGERRREVAALRPHP